MARYQLRYLDASSGGVVSRRDFDAEGDEAAIAYADNARRMAAMELWERDRKVKEWEAFPPD